MISKNASITLLSHCSFTFSMPMVRCLDSVAFHCSDRCGDNLGASRRGTVHRAPICKTAPIIRIGGALKRPFHVLIGRLLNRYQMTVIHRQSGR